jgi:hypothetical protein
MLGTNQPPNQPKPWPFLTAFFGIICPKAIQRAAVGQPTAIATYCSIDEIIRSLHFGVIKLGFFGKSWKRSRKSPFLMGKSTINAPFSIAFCMFTRPGNQMEVSFAKILELR